MRLDANRLRALDNPLGTVVVSGTLGASGDLARALARGSLTVDRADFQIPDAVGPNIPVLEVTEVRDGRVVEGPGAVAPPFDLGFDVTLDIPGRLFVRGRGLDSEWGGRLLLKGDLADPVIEGGIEVRRGIFDVLDRRFTIERGLVDFVGSRPPMPMLDLAATADANEIKVTVALRGPAQDPELTLTSEPPVAQDEILARLLFGTTVARISPIQGLRLAAAVQELQGSGVVTGALTRLRRATGIDTLDLQTTEQTDEQGQTTQQTTARVGKYVTDQVYLEVEQGMSQGTGKARVQVDLTPNLAIGSTVTDQSQTGVGLQWRYDY